MRTTARAAEVSPYLAAAIEIGESLVAGAVPETVGVTWVGDDLIGDETNTTVVHGPVRADFYGGASGIAWFLGHLARATSSEEFGDFATAGLEFALLSATREIGLAGASFYSGATGVALAAADVSHCLDDAELRNEALALGQRIASATVEGSIIQESDLLGGLAGLVMGLLAFYRISKKDLYLEAARIASNQLADRRSTSWWGSSWPGHGEQPALCGLGHGASGIGLALAETAWATGDRRLLEVAHEAFKYERSYFSRERCAWPDLRKPEARGWTTAWCHGGLGIGAVRLRCFEATGADWALAEASAAMQSARALAVQVGRDSTDGIAHDVTLCHGLGGATELILLAGEILKQPEHGLAARRVADLCLRIKGINQGSWTNGLRGTNSVPGLFVGLAGIGVSMLRVDNISSIGSPLLPGRLPRQPTGKSSIS